ncbi:MAG: Signal peptidase-like protein [Bacteroidetes bacterium]|nr:Signal peptidase-like protein [Bacteroidota bacterium]MCZ2132051.1 Signal peptidase-like protein [Bacteroidota bacterium]
MKNEQVVSLSQISLPHHDGLPSAAIVSVSRTILNRKSNCDSCETGYCNGNCNSCENKPASVERQPEFFKPENNILAETAFKGGRKILIRNRNYVPAALGDIVVIQAETGIDAGRICAVGCIAEDIAGKRYKGELPDRDILRVATADDIERLNENRRAEIEITTHTRLAAKQYGLDMKIVDAEWQFDRSRLTIFFTSPQRVDFRELVKELVRLYKTRIELRQIPAREEAKRLGGIGPCGLELCCTSFLTEFGQITLDHAKAQLLPGNMSKLSGMCGRLKCCLLYEIDNYVTALKNYPPLDSTVETASGRGRMMKIDIFKDVVTLFLEESHNYLTLTLEEINALRRENKIRLPDA